MTWVVESGLESRLPQRNLDTDVPDTTSPISRFEIHIFKLLPVEWNFRGIICRNIPFRTMRDVQQKLASPGGCD
jgi:hypothetical protein